MNIESLVLCDAATESGGKLNILGAFDIFFTDVLPFTFPYCSIVVRVRGKSKKDNGKHKLKISFTDSDGVQVSPIFENQFEFSFKNQYPTATVNFILSLLSLNISKYGEYKIEASIDDSVNTHIPVYVISNEMRSEALDPIGEHE